MYSGLGPRQFGEAILENFLNWLYAKATEPDYARLYVDLSTAEKGGVFGVGAGRTFVPRFLIACSHVTHLLPAMFPPLITLMFISSTRPSLALLHYLPTQPTSLLLHPKPNE